MKWVFRSGIFLCLLAVFGLILYFCLPFFNDFQTSGELELSGLQDKVRVTRDSNGMAYIHAQNNNDLFFAQGFVTAQDRLFQMQLTRLYMEGRLCELAGEKARPVDLRMRTLGLYRMADKQTRILNPETRQSFQKYVDGINAFIKNCPDDIHLEFKAAGIRPDRWEVRDAVGVLYYMGYSTAANLRTEIIAQMLLDVLGYEKTAMLLPLNINVDDPDDQGEIHMPSRDGLALSLGNTTGLLAYTRDRKLRAGSNNWAMGPAKSVTGSAVLAGDPHLDTRMLPGVWYPLGLISPDIRAVGVQIPGIPGMSIGRTRHIALSATNNYGDMQDLYVETVDPANPDHYLEGEASIPFIRIKETLRIKDKSGAKGFLEEAVEIRATRRGPVVSGVIPGLDAARVVTLRFAPAESMTPELGILDLLTAGNAGDVARVVQQISLPCLNWVFADTQGNIGHQASGKIPVRADGDGTFPHLVRDGRDNWQGWIPPDLMPGSLNPDKNWVGTCNHKTVDSKYPFYYTSYFSPSYRYSRLKQLMSGSGKKGLEDMWQFQRDTKNLMAEKIAPVLAEILIGNSETQDLGKILAAWDFMDDTDQPGPTIFQTLYPLFIRAVFEDDLGKEKAMELVKTGYFWQERLQQIVLNGRSPFFDDIRTPEKTETMSDLVIKAAGQARADLSAALGDDPGQWLWGKVHYLELVNPLMRSGKGKALLGTGPLPMGGSGETLYRGWFDFDKPYEVTHCAALRLVADMGDKEKIMAVIPGGAAGRTFHPHQKDQVKDFMDGKVRYWWLSDRAIEEHARARLILVP